MFQFQKALQGVKLLAEVTMDTFITSTAHNLTITSQDLTSARDLGHPTTIPIHSCPEPIAIKATNFYPQQSGVKLQKANSSCTRNTSSGLASMAIRIGYLGYVHVNPAPYMLQSMSIMSLRDVK
jgi:hypothetical protein